MGSVVDRLIDNRMRNQTLRGSRLRSAADVVRRLGAVQAQDYGGAAWAVAQRTTSVTRLDVDQALAAGSIVRTHVLRPTWHLVAAEDIRWMLDLTAPRVRAAAASGERESGLTSDVIANSHRIMARALAEAQRLTRPQLGEALRAGGVDIRDSLALLRLTLRAELDGVICSGGLRGKQQTYALLDAGVAAAPPRPRDEALAELACRYFSSHGPATTRDFAWWSGLSTKDAEIGARTATPALDSSQLDSTTYWFRARRASGGPAAVDAHLLPNFDEYTVAYADRSHVIDPSYIRRLQTRDDSIFANVVLVSGRILGTWRRTLSRTGVHVAVRHLRPLSGEERSAIEAATERFGRFLDLTATLQLDEAMLRAASNL